MNWMVLFGLVGIVVITVLVMMSGEGPTTAAGRFMAALADGDEKELTKLSYMPDREAAVIEQEWKRSTDLSKHVVFAWKFIAEQKTGPDTANVRLQITKATVGYEENYSLPMRKVDGQWKVEVDGLSRQLYPFLPR